MKVNCKYSFIMRNAFILFLHVIILTHSISNQYGIKYSFLDTLMFTIINDCMHCFTLDINNIARFSECSSSKINNQRFDIVNVKQMSLFHRIKYKNHEGNYLSALSGTIDFRIIPANGNNGYYILSSEGNSQCLSNKIIEEKELLGQDLFRNCKNLENSNSDIVFYFKQTPDNKYLKYKVNIKLYEWNSNGLNYALLNNYDDLIIKNNFPNVEFSIKKENANIMKIFINNYTDIFYLQSSNTKYEILVNTNNLVNDSIACSYKIANLIVEFEIALSKMNLQI